MKNVYVTPGVERLRVFLEENITVTLSTQVVGAGSGVTQDDWDGSYTLTAAKDDITIII
jgi:hypothetical protein